MQTSYNIDPAPGVVGAIAETGSKTVRARAADSPVRVGQYVILAGDFCHHPSAAPTPAQRGGVVMRNPYRAESIYLPGEMLDIVTFGAIWVASETAVLADTNAFVRFTAAGAEQLGAFRGDADGTDAAHIAGLYYRTPGTQLVWLEVNKSAAP